MNTQDINYIEDFDSADFATEALHESARTYIEDFDDADFGIFEDYDNETETDVELTEDLQSSFPVIPMSESEIRLAAKKIVKGAKVRFGWVKSLPLASIYAHGKFVKKDNTQYPLVRAIKVTETRACTGVNYNNTEGAKLLHSTQEYQDKLAARLAAGKGGYGTNVHDSEAGLENILVTTARGLKCILAYRLSTAFAHNKYYISIDNEDWRQTDKQEIAQYMSPAEATKFLSSDEEDRANYQSNVRNNAGQNTYVDDEFTVRDLTSGEKLKLLPNPLNITYFDPTDPFKCVFALDKESAVIPETVEVTADVAPLDQEFPEID